MTPFHSVSEGTFSEVHLQNPAHRGPGCRVAATGYETAVTPSSTTAPSLASVARKLCHTALDRYPRDPPPPAPHPRTREDSDGKQSGSHRHVDLLGVMQQLGAVPEAGHSGGASPT
jgi:hypothetical protein